MKDPTTEEGWEEEDSQSASKKEVQGESDCAAYACQPSLTCEPNLVHQSYSNRGDHYGDINPNASGKTNCNHQI